MLQKSLKIVLPFLTAFVLALVIGCGGDDAGTNPDNPTVPVTVTDIDGNVYQTVTIGTQVWMAENLKVTHYRNGDEISYAIGSMFSDSISAYCNYNDDVGNVAIYGRLYNWHAVADSRNIAPVGWHVPSDAEWQTLIDLLGGEAVAGGKMKETGTTHWLSPNTGATNTSGFSALPGGNLNSGNYEGLGHRAYFWSSTEVDFNGAWDRYLNHDKSSVDRFTDSKIYYWSIRCVKD